MCRQAAYSGPVRRPVENGPSDSLPQRECAWFPASATGSAGSYLGAVQPREHRTARLRLGSVFRPARAIRSTSTANPPACQ